ncbi:IPT/TIG domain-containing protein, partial [Nanoarchaeota archaeon]
MTGVTSLLKYSMPIIELPPSGSDPVAHYATVMGGDIQVEPAPNEGLKFSLSDSADKRLFAMAKGFVKFIPSGDPLGDPVLLPGVQEQSPGAGSIYLQVEPSEVANLKTELSPLTGVPPMGHIFYLNVSAESARDAVRPHVQTLTEATLKQAWTHLGLAVPTYVDKTDLEEEYLVLFMHSKVKVEVGGGHVIGDVSPKDLNDTSLGAEFTLRFLDTSKNDLSPILHIRNFPVYGGQEWEGHPLIAKVSDIPVPVDIYLKFEIWEKGTGNYLPLPADIEVDIKDSDFLPPDDLLGTRKTDANGCVHFSSSDDPTDPTNPNKKGLPLLLEPGHDIYFVVRTNGTTTHAGHTLPEEWSTMGWKALHGQSGYYKDFAGAQLGESTKPMTFRVGVDYHFKFTYLDNNGATCDAPKGVQIQFFKQSGALVFHEDRTDMKGEVHGINFDIGGENSIYLRIPFRIEDSFNASDPGSIDLPMTEVKTDEQYWDTKKRDADYKEFIDIVIPSIGDYVHPEKLHATIKERNVAFYFMKLLRELSIFLNNLTDGDWKGIPDLKIFTTSLSGYGYAWPVGHVNIPPNAHWNRSTIIHEISHQVMWKEVGYSTLGILYEATYFGLIGDLYMIHGSTYYTNRQHALMEGWAEFIQEVFESKVEPPYYWVTLANLRNESGDPHPSTATLPSNWGERVEGAFANGLWTLFRKHVAGLSPLPSSPAPASAQPIIPETPNGDIAGMPSWITNASIKQKFIDIIWKPMKDLKTADRPTSIVMLNNIKLNNASSWAAFLPDLQNFNLAMQPTITAISPANGPVGGGQEITITGTNFVEGIEIN